jgi:hypothetical protein
MALPAQRLTVKPLKSAIAAAQEDDPDDPPLPMALHSMF